MSKNKWSPSHAPYIRDTVANYRIEHKKELTYTRDEAFELTVNDYFQNKLAVQAINDIKKRNNFTDEQALSLVAQTAYNKMQEAYECTSTYILNAPIT